MLIVIPSKPDSVYCNAVFFIFLSRYGDIYATSTSEVKIACFVMVVGLLAFAGVIMTGMSSIISNLDAQRGRFYNRMDAIRIHMVQYYEYSQSVGLTLWF